MKHADDTLTTSVVSAPKRGPWGDARYRGNCDGGIIRKLILHYNAARVADPMEGGGTTRDVVLDLNRSSAARQIRYWGSDLHRDFDLRREIPPGPFDFLWVHPPY